MDPALHELLAADRSDREIEAIVRLRRADAEVPHVRMVARFGTIATCRIPAAAVPEVHGHPDVVSLKAPRRVSAGDPPGPRRSVPDAAGARPTDVRRPAGPVPTGAGVVVAAVDWGLDFQAAPFRKPDGATRLLALWDQRDAAAGPAPAPYGYGAIHDRAAIDRALARPRPYRELGYHPAIADRGQGAHGTHVLDIAAGNGRGGGPVGLAPEADLVFIHLSDRDTAGLFGIGDSVRLLEGIDAVARTAAHRPWVLNLSMGRHGGPHDGTSLVELAFGELLRAAPGRFIVQSAGNYYRARAHTGGRLAPGESRTFSLISDVADASPNELEIWYDGRDELRVRIDPPGQRLGRAVRLGQVADLVVDGRQVGRVYHRRQDPNNGDNHVDAFLYPAGCAGEWRVTVEAVRIRNGRFDAWVERDEACPRCQARFARSDSRRWSTTGSISSASLPLVVGAYAAHLPQRPPARFSSAGPTRGGLPKPDVAAPGVEVLAARSAALGNDHSPAYLVRKSGTSMAAPHVTGAVALVLAATHGRVSADEIRSLVMETSDPAPEGSRNRLGRGYLNVPRLLAAAAVSSARGAGPILPKEATMSHLTADLPQRMPASVYREVAYRPDGGLARRIRARYDPIGLPGDRVTEPARAGDLLVEVRLGQPGVGACRVLGEAELQQWSAGSEVRPGRLLLRQRDTEPVPSDAEEQVPAHVAAARKLWKQVAKGDPVLEKVVIHGMAYVPSDLVRVAGYAGWTNSATRVYVATSANTDPDTLEAVLRHEAEHVKQFHANGGKPPADYATMMRFERDAYAAPGPGLPGRSGAVVDDIRDFFRDSARRYGEMISTAEKWLPAGVLRELLYAVFLYKEGLPTRVPLKHLYSPPRTLRNRHAVEEAPTDESAESAGCSDADLARAVGISQGRRRSQLQGFDSAFRGTDGPAFHALVGELADTVGLDPGLVAVSLLAEVQDPGLWLGAEPVTNEIAGVDYWHSEAPRIRRAVPAAARIDEKPLLDAGGRPVSWVNERGNDTGTQHEFASGSDAALAVAAATAWREQLLRGALPAGQYDGLPDALRFMAVRYSFNAGPGAAKRWLTGASGRRPRLVRRGEIGSHHPLRTATVRAAQAMHLSQRFFGKTFACP